MQFTFLSAHSVQGIVHNQTAPDLVLYDDPQVGVRVTLTADPNRHLRTVNRQLALASMMFRAMIREPLDEAFPQNLADHIAKIETQRLDAAGTDGVVVVQVTGDVSATIPTDARALTDFLLCFDAVDKAAQRRRCLPKVTAVLTALRLSGNGSYEFRLLAEGSFLTTAEGVIVHSMTLEGGSVGMYQSMPLNEGQRERIAKNIPLILKFDKLERLVRLYAHSLNTGTDNYRSFIAAWSALEILIGKIFPIYQPLLASELRRGNQSAGVRAYLDRVDEVMEGKYNPADKFSVISVFLADESKAEEMMTTFRRLKKVRDGLFHGEDISEESLPTGEVQQLFDEYLGNHLRREAPSSGQPVGRTGPAEAG
ncbi:hypothetical protein AYO43_09620 [Nitrospira sp. SCGC AG-212-E16]|nr:hypothetical protein AYO43_09620 [Nitrospira sp. SCGC AG-212-E16]